MLFSPIGPKVRSTRSRAPPRAQDTPTSTTWPATGLGRARVPNRGATPSGTSTNSLYRAVLSRGSLLHIIRRFAFTILRNRPHACTHASHLPIAMGGTLDKFKFAPIYPPLSLLGSFELISSVVSVLSSAIAGAPSFKMDLLLL